LSGIQFQPPQGTSPNLSDAFDVRPLFKGADPREREFKLADFIVLTLDISPLELKKRLGGGTKSLFDFAYELKAAGKFLRVDPEIPNKKWRINTQIVVIPTLPQAPQAARPACCLLSRSPRSATFNSPRPTTLGICVPST